MGQHFHRVQGAREKQIKRRMVKFRAGEVELPWLLKGFTVLQLKRLLDGGTAPDTAFPHTFLMSGFGTVWDTLGCTHLAQLLSTVSEHDCPPAGLHSYCSGPTSLSTGTSTCHYVLTQHATLYHHKASFSLQEAWSQHSEEHRVRDHTFSPWDSSPLTLFCTKISKRFWDTE